MSVLQYVFHLWAVPPIGLQLQCPPAPAGVTGNPQGFFDDATVQAAFNTAVVWSAVAVLATILVCYLLTRTATGPRFDRRWLVSLLIAACLSAGVTYGTLHSADTTAMAQSCTSNPSAFPIPLPSGVVVNRAIAGLVWGLIAFTVGSVLLTLLFGWYPALRNGFYHNRGTPWPRLMPGGE